MRFDSFASVAWNIIFHMLYQKFYVFEDLDPNRSHSHDSFKDGSTNLLLMEEILHQLIDSSSHYLRRVFCIPGGCLGFLPSTVSHLTWALSSSSTSRTNSFWHQDRPDSNYAKESSVRLDNCTLNDMMLGFNI